MQTQIAINPPDLKEVMERKQAEESLKLLCETAHYVIHSKKEEGGMKVLKVDGIEYPVTYAANGCRQIKYGQQMLFMEQNKQKASRYAEEARNGKRITWCIRPEGWIYIDDNGPKL